MASVLGLCHRRRLLKPEEKQELPQEQDEHLTIDCRDTLSSSLCKATQVGRVPCLRECSAKQEHFSAGAAFFGLLDDSFEWARQV